MQINDIFRQIWSRIMPVTDSPLPDPAELTVPAVTSEGEVRKTGDEIPVLTGEILNDDIAVDIPAQDHRPLARLISSGLALLAGIHSFLTSPPLVAAPDSEGESAAVSAETETVSVFRGFLDDGRIALDESTPVIGDRIRDAARGYAFASTALS